MNDSSAPTHENQTDKTEDISVDLITFKEEAELKEPRKEYFGRFVRKDVGGKTKNYIRSQNGSVKL